ncbi:MAG: S8 family serine peptidase [Gammaproteobacteria bacterium]|nr:S8 family serine peptidase [Gammaproteobacteria bacterium]
MTFKSAPSRVIFMACLLTLSGRALAQALPDPASEEFLKQYGLRFVNVFPAWSNTTGSGITIATLDSGVNVTHVELLGRIAAGGDVGDVDTGGGHGTSVAGIIASNFNGQGIIGVAYDASILPIRVTDSNRFAGSDAAAAGFNRAAARSDVRVITFTAGTIFSEPQNSAIINATKAGKLVIIRAGNDSQANPDIPPSVYGQFNGGGIIVGGTGQNNTLLDMSNRAGGAAAVYMVAPGLSIYAPGNRGNTSYVTWTGTSVATPHVAGAAALILAQNPELTSQQVVEILFNSATDLGAPGVDAIYGHGMLNVGAALAAQGGVGASSSGSSGGLGVGIAALAVGGGLAYFWSENKKAEKDLEKTLVFDKYNRPYIMNLNQTLNVQNSAPTLFNVMNMFDRQTRTVDVIMSDNLSMSLHTRATNPADYVFLKDSDPFLENYDEVRDRDLSMKVAGSFNSGFSFNLQHNYTPSSGFDKVGNLSLSENFIWASSYGLQYMGFGNRSDNVSMGYKASKKLSFQFGANRLNNNKQNRLSSEAVMLQGSYSPTEKMSVSLRVNNLFEDGNLLGGASSGAFSVANANTTAIGLTGQYRIFDKFSLFGSFTEGFTGVKQQRGSFLQSFTTLRSYSWGTGIIGKSLFRYNDRAGFAVSSPLRISNGSADLLVPQSLDSQRNVINSRTRVSLAPEGREIDFEAFYRMNLNRRTQVGTTLTYRDTPENTSYIGKGLSVFTTVGLRF